MGGQVKKKESKPPKWITRFFRWFCNPEMADIIEGDLIEQFYNNVKEYGRKRANQRYFWNVLLFFQPFAIRRNIKLNSKFNKMDMYRNYFKSGIRNLNRHIGLSFIKIFGLAVGMACTILILLFVENQLNYDKGQVNRDNIVRLESSWVVMPPYLRETALQFPEVEDAVRFFFWVEPTLKYGETVFTVENFALVDSTIFNVFNFKFLSGSSATAFSSPNSIVLTKKIALRLFKNENPIGKLVRMGGYENFVVSGVIADVEKLHMDINAFVSMQDIARLSGSNDLFTSRNYNHSIYLKLGSNIDRDHLIAKINERAIKEDEYDGDSLLLRDYEKIYFAENLSHEKNTKHGNINLVIAFAAIGIMILIIACINFINLTIAKTRNREREIAIRKVSGAQKGALQSQFFIETMLVVLISFVFAFLFVGLFLPTFSNLVGEPLNFWPISYSMGIVIFGVLIFTIFISGIYPALYLARASALSILKGNSIQGSKNSIFSKLLISFQYAISIFLIIAAITVIKQLHFMQNQDLGINHEHVLTLTLKGEKFQGEAEEVLASKAAFKQQLMTNPNIKGITFLNQFPGKITNTNSMRLTAEDEAIPYREINTDPDFIDLMGIQLLEGRNLSYDMITDMDSKMLVNEEAVKQLGLENPVGTVLSNGVEIIGVTKDFHYNSMHKNIVATAIVWDYWTMRTCIKLSGNNLKETILDIENTYKQFSPGVGFEYEFLDQSFDRQYIAEKRLERIVTYFVGLAILLSCLGLFALTAFVAEQKAKEIGIRKVLGSSNSAIIFLLSNNFTKWIIIANIVSWPIAYLILSNWLQSFDYRINLGAGVFIISGLVAFLIAFLTMGIQGIKSAFLNPVESLKYE